MTIPTLIEQDIKSGKARYQTFQTGIGGQSVLKVTPNSYIVIFGYDFSPAGGGVQTVNDPIVAAGGTFDQVNGIIRPFGSQQVSFYTGQAFYPFVHHVPFKNSALPYEVTNAEPSFTSQVQTVSTIDNKPMNRSVYIISGSNVSIQVGLMNKLDEEGAGVLLGPIAVTSNTPNAVTYGGDGNQHAVQSFLASATGSIFTQPSVEPVDFYNTGFGPQPNAEAQVYLKPEPGSAATGIGLIDPSEYIAGLSADLLKTYNPHYFLNVHYALYTNQISEQLG